MCAEPAVAKDLLTRTPRSRRRLTQHQHSMLLLQQKSHKLRQDTSTTSYYFQNPTTTTLKHLLHAQVPCQAQEASVQTTAAGAPWLPAKQIGSLQDRTEAVHLSFLSSSS